jgi:hypothetical protein
MAEKSSRLEEQQSLTVPEATQEQTTEPIVAVPGGADGLKLQGVPPGHGKPREPTLRLHNVHAKSGASYPLVLGDPAVTRKRRRA